jgi:hypothetical protein
MEFVVSHNNPNIGTIHPAMLGTAPGIVAAYILLQRAGPPENPWTF